VLGH